MNKDMQNNNNNIKILVSVGEIFDKITILEIKKNKIKAKDKLINIKKELLEIKDAVSHLTGDNLLSEYIINLKKVNLELWTIEDEIRIKESNKSFDNEFIELARSVYIVNDKRAVIKKNINIHTNSHLIEEKSYSSY